MTNLVTNLILDVLYSSGMWLDLAPKTDTKKDICLKKDWTMRSKYDNHSKLNSQHNWGNLFDHALNTRMSTLIMSKIFIRAPKIMKKSGYDLDLNSLTISY